MSFDSHSLERLRELGRRLPERLPPPEPRPAAAPKATERRHRVETEENPEELFRELMRVSPDGTVPPHLMERLRQLESERTQSQKPAAASPAATTPSKGRKGRRDPEAAEGMDLYLAFQQMLLEDEEEAG
ncbi:MAG: hypothetical protein ACKO5F_01815 [Synechococcus sp.]